MSAVNEKGPGVGSPDLSSARQNAALGSDRTTGHPVERGSLVVLVDAAGVADQIIEKAGCEYARELGHALLAPLRGLAGTHLVTTWRVTWRGRWWKASTAAKSRTFTRGADARRVATRKFRDGYDVSVHTCSRTAWAEVPATDWLQVDGAEVVR